MARTGGERSRHVSTAAKLVRSIGGETPPLRGQSAPPLSQRTHRAAASSALPPSRSVASARRRGWPVGPGRSLFTVSATAKLVKSIGHLLRLLPRRFRVDPSSGRALGAEGGSGRRWRGWFAYVNDIGTW